MSDLIASLIAPRSREFGVVDADADVVTVELASHWDLEAAGMVLDWSHFPPHPAAGAPTRPPTGARARALTAAIREARAALPPEKLIAVSITGPGLATAEVLAASAPAPGVGTASRPTAVRAPAAPAPWSGGATLGGTPPRTAGPFGHAGAATDGVPPGAGEALPLGDAPGALPRPPATAVAPAVSATLKAAAAAVIEAGAGLVWIVEDPYRAVAAQDLVPLLTAIRGLHAIPALLLAGPADAAWRDNAALRQAVPVFDPVRSPGLATDAAAHARRPHGLLDGDRARLVSLP